MIEEVFHDVISAPSSKKIYDSLKKKFLTSCTKAQTV
jgi:hypothetical protein